LIDQSSGVHSLSDLPDLPSRRWRFCFFVSAEARVCLRAA